MPKPKAPAERRPQKENTEQKPNGHRPADNSRPITREDLERANATAVGAIERLKDEWRRLVYWWRRCQDEVRQADKEELADERRELLRQQALGRFREKAKPRRDEIGRLMESLDGTEGVMAAFRVAHSLATGERIEAGGVRVTSYHEAISRLFVLAFWGAHCCETAPALSTPDAILAEDGRAPSPLPEQEGADSTRRLFEIIAFSMTNLDSSYWRAGAMGECDRAIERLRTQAGAASRTEAAGAGGAAEQDSDAPSEAEAVATKAGIGKKARAIAALLDHPDWTDKQIAQDVGCHVKSLYRWPAFIAARKMLKQGRADMPRGARDAETGRVEAWDDDRE
ncbi:MAG: hypothetical protein JW809_16555 [Pirellulales bacterium]|nr:hypothetical protein [Pirellulales bacterium]